MSEQAKEPDEAAAQHEPVPPADAQMEAVEIVQLLHRAAESRTTDEPPPSGDETVEYVELVPVYNAADLTEAQLVKGLLESAQVPCAIEDDASGALTDALTGARLDGTDVFVPAAYVEAARRVLAAHGYAAGIDRERATELVQLLEAALGGGEQERARFLEALEEEPSRETRLAVLRALERLPHLEEAIATLVRASLNAEEEGRVLEDLALLVAEREMPRTLAARLAADLAEATRSDSAARRRRAATALGKLRGVGAARSLVALLEDPDESVRDAAIESLYALTGGESFGYEPDAPPAERAAAVERWRAWLAKNPEA
ncbi:MAG: hypothetical protein KatS3mg102_0930 [Planctomycetota bacterium]|nr:MAG: hypothetical protein KatS3mg102_0930 [Planctomycetota bacterium]